MIDRLGFLFSRRWWPNGGHAIRAWQWAVLLQLLFATALPGAQARLTAADAGTQGTASPSANGSYLGSRLVSPKSESSCPPNIGPMYRADAIVTDTDMRQRPWGFAQTLREVLVYHCSGFSVAAAR
jgi:hypothetical protein